MKRVRLLAVSRLAIVKIEGCMRCVGAVITDYVGTSGVDDHKG